MPKTILKKYFGYDEFRDGQEVLINAILNGNDVLGIMPTGAGKSICFQVPAMLLSGITLVISPLISLMKDQVNSLTQSGINAAFINSSLTPAQYNNVLERAINLEYKIIYVAPERLNSFEFLQFVQYSTISMVTIDEAHCISQWGQDFRPSYVKIVDFIDSLPIRPIVSAFTATATLTVRKDIVDVLRLQNPNVLVTGFDRKNLYFEVKKPKNKLQALVNFLKDKKEKTGIVYCSTRKTVEKVCEELNKLDYLATQYHAGLSDAARKKNQDDFIYDRCQIIVATNAFGMGIDKSNVSFVVHFNMPKNIESYYQEAGRAGRDGEDAECILLYSGQDVMTNTWFIENTNDVSYKDDESEKTLKDRDRKRLKQMTFYCHTTKCLREYILNYFGEISSDNCGNCFNCNNKFDNIDITIPSQKILSCVVRADERYGVNTIVDTLRGSKAEKILRFGLNKLSTYGIMTESSKYIHNIINFLIIDGYLLITDDEFPILKLGSKASEILRDRKVIEMKIIKEAFEYIDNDRQNIILKPVNNDLFELLKSLRTSIATEQGVPAYIVCSNSTLTDMCMKLPTNNSEMLNVSGIGQTKLEKYGEQFLKAIANFKKQDIIHNIDENVKLKVKISDEPISSRVLADNINCYLLQNGIKKINAAKMNDWLVSLSYLQVVQYNNKNHKQPTQLGLELGIKAKINEKDGLIFKTNIFDKYAQKFIVDRLDNILTYINNIKNKK